MPTMLGRTTVGNNQTSSNVLSGEPFEILPYNALIEYGMTASTIGVNADLTAVGNPLGESQLLNQEVVANLTRTPIYPDDFIGAFTSVAGSRLILRFRNTNASSITAQHHVRITPVQL